MFNVYKNQQSRQTGSRNLTGPKTLPTIWYTNMKLVTKYQIPVINNCLEKCDEKCAYMLNVYKSQLHCKSANRKQESDGSKNASHDMGYLYEACDQISDFCHQKLLRKMRRKISCPDGRSGGIKTFKPYFKDFFSLVSNYQLKKHFQFLSRHPRSYNFRKIKSIVEFRISIVVCLLFSSTLRLISND